MPSDLSKYRIKRSSRETIEPEEIFLDSKRIEEFPGGEKEKLEVPIKRKNFVLFFGFVIFLLASLLFRAGHLQIVKGDYYKKLAEENRIRSYPIRALRGIIYDNKGEPLVINNPDFDVMIIPQDFPEDDETLANLIEDLSQILDLSVEEINYLIEDNLNLSGEQPVLLKEGIKKEEALILKSMAEEISGILVEISSRRKYILGPYFSHILGYISKVSPKDLELHPRYLLNDYIGKTGLELYYEEILRGVYGEKKVEVNSQRGEIELLSLKPVETGNGLVLSIDSGLQKMIYQELNGMLRGLSTSRAAAIALDPKSGKILAMVSLPGFDNNKFLGGYSQEELQKIFQNPSLPLFNRAISGQYPSGSTIKPLIASAALKEGIIDPYKNVFCQGAISVPSKYNPDSSWVFRDWKTHGAMDMIKGIAESCNVYFYTIGGGLGDIEGLGIKKIEKYLRYFGLGSILEIDLPGEARGLIPTEEWKREIKGEEWYIGDTYHAAIGQGDISVTPLQIAFATAAIANGGVLWRPQVLDKIVDSNKNIIRNIEPQIIRKNFINEEFLRIVKKGMREAVISGSAKSLYNLPVKVAGKTGTAEAPGNKAPHAWFTSFAPYDNPEIALTILIENGGGGSSVAVPVAREVLRWYFTK